jgi:hypothetical protein
MKNVLKKLLGLALIGTVVFTFSFTTSAEESLDEGTSTDDAVVEEVLAEENFEEATEVVEVETEFVEEIRAVVTLTIKEEYNFVLNENGTILLIEGPNEELIATLLEEGTTLNEAIQAIVATYDEEMLYTIAITANDEELAKAIEESLEEVVEQEVEIEISEQPEFIIKRFEMANELGITPGKMHLLEKLVDAIGEEINYEEWSQKSVKEIMSEIKANRAMKDKNDSEDKDTQFEAAEDVVADEETVEAKKEKLKPENNKGKTQDKDKNK